MQSETCFTDSEDRVWDLKLTLGTAKTVSRFDFSEVQKELGLQPEPVNLINYDSDLMQLLLTSTPMIAAVAFAIGKATEQHTDVDEQAFLDAMDGEALAHCKRALWGALANFYPDQKTALELLLEKQTKALARLEQAARESLEETDSELSRLIKREQTRIRTSVSNLLSEGDSSPTPKKQRSKPPKKTSDRS